VGQSVLSLTVLELFRGSLKEMFILHRVLLVPSVIHMVKWRNILAAGGHLALLRGITIARVYYLWFISPNFAYPNRNNIHQNKSASGAVFVQLWCCLLWAHRKEWITNWFQWLSVLRHFY